MHNKEDDILRLSPSNGLKNEYQLINNMLIYYYQKYAVITDKNNKVLRISQIFYDGPYFNFERSTCQLILCKKVIYCYIGGCVYNIDLLNVKLLFDLKSFEPYQVAVVDCKLVVCIKETFNVYNENEGKLELIQLYDENGQIILSKQSYIIQCGKQVLLECRISQYLTKFYQIYSFEKIKLMKQDEQVLSRKMLYGLVYYYPQQNCFDVTHPEITFIERKNNTIKDFSSINQVATLILLSKKQLENENGAQQIEKRDISLDQKAIPKIHQLLNNSYTNYNLLYNFNEQIIYVCDKQFTILGVQKMKIYFLNCYKQQIQTNHGLFKAINELSFMQNTYIKHHFNRLIEYNGGKFYYCRQSHSLFQIHGLTIKQVCYIKQKFQYAFTIIRNQQPCLLFKNFLVISVQDSYNKPTKMYVILMDDSYQYKEAVVNFDGCEIQINTLQCFGHNDVNLILINQNLVCKITNITMIENKVMIYCEIVYSASEIKLLYATQSEIVYKNSNIMCNLSMSGQIKYIYHNTQFCQKKIQKPQYFYSIETQQLQHNQEVLQKVEQVDLQQLETSRLNYFNKDIFQNNSSNFFKIKCTDIFNRDNDRTIQLLQLTEKQYNNTLVDNKTYSKFNNIPFQIREHLQMLERNQQHE